jgi:hypothetical protein
MRMFSGARRLTFLAWNASVFIAKPFTEYTAADFAGILAPNLAGFVHISRPAVRPPDEVVPGASRKKVGEVAASPVRRRRSGRGCALRLILNQ